MSRGNLLFSDTELEAILDSMECGVALFDATDRLHLANRRFAELMRSDGRRWEPGTEFESLLADLRGCFRNWEEVAERWREIHRSGEEAAWDELELVRPAGKGLERFARPLFDAAGARSGLLEVYRVIGGDRPELGRLLQIEKLAALGQGVAGITHELNNPLTSILGYAQLLAAGRSADPAGDARRIFQEARRARHTVQSLLLFAHDARPERAPADLNGVVERTLSLRRYNLQTHNIAVELDLHPRLPATPADEHQLQQVILNLLLNAEQAILEGNARGRIRIATRPADGQRLAMEISDDGPGIPSGILSRIFDPFFTTKPPGAGTGLGLSIVHGIVKEHGGTVFAESPPGGGAIFTIELPAVVSQPEAPVLLRKVSESAGGEWDSGRGDAAAPGRRILIVEDEPTVADLIADVLAGQGHRVETMTESQKALEHILFSPAPGYDLIICDIKMPRLDGPALHRVLVQQEHPAKDRILFVTGDTLAPRTLEFLENNGLASLAKPFLVEELTLAVNASLQNSSWQGHPETHSSERTKMASRSR